MLSVTSQPSALSASSCISDTPSSSSNTSYIDRLLPYVPSRELLVSFYNLRSQYKAFSYLILLVSLVRGIKPSKLCHHFRAKTATLLLYSVW